jgi:hypothetical protein
MASERSNAATDHEKRQLANQLSKRWPYSYAAILTLLERLDQWGADWRHPHYVLKMVRDADLDLNEISHAPTTS